MMRPNTRSQTKKRSRKNEDEEKEKDKKFQALVSVSEEEIKQDEDILDGLTFSRDGKHVKVDEKLLRRLKASSEVEVEVIRKNPFQDCPVFLETIQTGSPLTMDFIQECSNAFNSNPDAVAKGNQLGTNPLDYLALIRNAMREDNWNYSVKIPSNPKVTDQESAGICWLESWINKMRYKLISKLHVDHKFEFSNTYLIFYDKIERANLFLEYMWNLRYRDLQDHEVRMFTSSGNHLITDGGNINFAISLIKKYGLLPKNVYSKGLNLQYTGFMNDTLIKVLNHMSLEIFRNKDNWNRNYFEVKKASYNRTIYDLVVKFLGEPPKPSDKFTWTYNDEHGETHTMHNLTAEKFYRVVIQHEDDNVISIINDPRHPETYFSPSYSEYSINMIGGQTITYINLPLDEFKKVICENLKNDAPVWFACDMNKAYDAENNTSDTKRFDYNYVLGLNIEHDKADELDACTSYANHAMLFNGVDTIEDKDSIVTGYKKWRVLNSWGNSLSEEETPDHGYARLTDSYFDKYVYMAVVELNFFEEETMKKILYNTKAGNSFTYKSTDAFSSQSLRADCSCCHKNKQNKTKHSIYKR
jgi:bleomycin hydrolase